MPTLLHIDASPQDASSSVSRQLSAQFVAQCRAANPSGKVITRDLTKTELPVVDAEWIGAAFSPEASHTPEQQHSLAISDALVAELQQADETVLAMPMFNLSIPAVVKLYIDQIVRAGKTFTFQNGGLVGLMAGKKATFLIASGSSFEAGTPFESWNFVDPYLRAIFAFIGITDVEFIRAGGTNRLKYGTSREEFLAPALAAIESRFAQPIAA